MGFLRGEIASGPVVGHRARTPSPSAPERSPHPFVRLKARSASVPSGATRRRHLAHQVKASLWNDQIAAAHTVFYLVAAALFLPIIGGLFLFLKDTADTVDKPSAGLRTRAVQGLAQITQSSGVATKAGEPATSSWETNIDALNGYDLKEIGILDEDMPGLSYPKIDNLQRGGLIENTGDEYVNYPEFKDVLSLGDKYDFHVRLYPVVHTGTTDPYGTGPVQTSHVAYVANLTNRNINGGEFSFTATAQAEIQALQDVKLGGSNANHGFDGRSYQPLNFLGINNPSLYTNLLAVKEGDVIGDTQLRYSQSLAGPHKPYWQWFVEDYLFFADGTNRYDVVVFGSDADLSRWDDPIAKTAFGTYLAQGGSLVFLGDKNLAPNFINECADASCLLYQTGSGAPVSTPDVTNQMLSTPNKLDWRSYYTQGSGLFYNICDQTGAGGVDERRGWIPIAIDDPDVDPCAQSVFGATSSDRFGPTGGTLIVDTWTVPTGELPDYLANVLSFAIMRSAFLDYGPEIPEDEVVESAERLMLLQLPSGQYIDVKIVFYLWENDCTATKKVTRGDLC